MSLIPQPKVTLGNKIFGVPTSANIQYSGINPADYRAQKAISLGIPKEYAYDVGWTSQHTGIPIERLAMQFHTENGGNWDPKLTGMKDPRDYGVTQLNRDYAIPDITGKSTGVNWFKKVTGHEFDINDPHDQILGAGVYMNLLRQYQLPQAGIKAPTDDDVIGSYHTGATKYANTKGSDAQTYIGSTRQLPIIDLPKGSNPI